MDPRLYSEFYEIEEHFWWSVSTRRIFFRLVAGVVGTGAARVLDVGCGTGITLHEFPHPTRLLVGCDMSADALSFCRRRGVRDLVRCDVTRLPFRAESVDLVLALDVIEHVDADEAAVREMARICRPGGHVLLHVPAFQVLWSDKDELNHHRRRYRREELIQLVERCGLRVRELFYLNSILFPIALVSALARRAHRRLLPHHAPASAQILRHVYHIPRPLNAAMTRVMRTDIWLMKVAPFGLSVVCLVEKASSG